MSEYDEYLMVQAESGQPNLMFADEKQQARFELGISMLVHSWDALDIAVINQWGGVESSDKRDWISGVIVDLFKDNKAVDAPLIEETLLYAMLDEFDTHVDDGTAQPVANNMIKLYDECSQLNFNRVEDLYTKWLEKQKNGPSKERYVQVDEVTSDEDEEKDDDDDDDGMDVDMEQEIPALATKSEPVVDDDGFELVQKKGKRRH
ncbi:pre-rRNA-processing protein Tsr2p [Monosporozyma unispora]|nr:rRNA accumulation- protein [Kazachstania unispora]